MLFDDEEGALEFVELFADEVGVQVVCYCSHMG